MQAKSQAFPELKCVVCGEMFIVKKKQQKTCSKLCGRSLITARQRVTRLRARGIVDKLPIVSCVICGAKFAQRQRGYVCCKKLLCRWTRDKQLQKIWRRENQGV